MALTLSLYLSLYGAKHKQNECLWLKTLSVHVNFPKLEQKTEFSHGLILFCAQRDMEQLVAETQTSDRVTLSRGMTQEIRVWQPQSHPGRRLHINIQHAVSTHRHSHE